MKKPWNKILKQTNKNDKNLRSEQRTSQKRRAEQRQLEVPIKHSKWKFPGESALQMQRGQTREGHQHPPLWQWRFCTTRPKVPYLCSENSTMERKFYC